MIWSTPEQPSGNHYFVVVCHDLCSGVSQMAFLLVQIIIKVMIFNKSQFGSHVSSSCEIAIFISCALMLAKCIVLSNIQGNDCC